MERGQAKLRRKGAAARWCAALFVVVAGTHAAGGWRAGAPVSAAAQPAPPPEAAVVLIRTANALRSARGSGFLIGDGSWVATASHVVAVDLGKGRRAFDRTALVYTPWTGRPYEAKVVAVDATADIALLRMPQGGFPALALEGLDLTDPHAAKSALERRPLRLFGFPLSWGEATVAALARPEWDDSRLREITRRGETSLCVLEACPHVQPGWSGGPVVAMDRGAVVAVFHSLYKPRADGPEGFPAGSLSGYLGGLLKQAGAADLSAFARPAPPALPQPEGAAERMAREMRSLSWSAAGEWKKAEEEQREILRAAPGDALARAELGRLLTLQGRLAEAVTELKEAVRLDPRSVVAHIALGRALQQAGDLPAALAAFRAAAEASPGEAEPRLALAEALQASGDAPGAEAALRAALEAVPGHPVARLRLGELLLRAGRAPEGMQHLAEASEQALNDPALAAVPLGYARALLTDRKFKEAEAVYRQLLRTDPENALACYYLAWLLLRLRRVDEAQALLNRGIALPHLSEEMVKAFQALQVRINEAAGG